MDLNKEAKIEKVFSLYRKFGNAKYIGEPVTQQEHASQCAVRAQDEGHSDLVVMGAFLHDVGHLLGEEQGTKENMVTDGIELGIREHEEKGAIFLQDLGFPEVRVEIARNHVNAKRYLCFKKQEYFNKLSIASKLTLEHQGGPMTAIEASAFERNPHFNVIILARKWDEAAKVENCKLKPLEYYEDMLKKCLS